MNAAKLALACTLLATLSASPVLAEPRTPEELEAWFNSNADPVDTVNEGELNFLASSPAEPVHHQQNRITIDRQSLEDGWIRLEQCHYHMDHFPRVQVVYNKDRIRKLEIVSRENIELAWVEGPSVQLVNVGKGASLCVRAESRALRRNADGSYTLRNGPFMRKFLDGYFPMHVSIDIRLPPELQVDEVQPAAQRGFTVSRLEGGLRLDAWFEGRLKTRIRLTPRKP